MNIAEGAIKLMNDRHIMSVSIKITNIDHLRILINHHLYARSSKIPKSIYDKVWFSLLTNDKEAKRTIGISFSIHGGIGVRTVRKDILDEWSRNELVFINDYDIPGAIPIKKEPKRKLEL